jgi:hypothetical protein
MQPADPWHGHHSGRYAFPSLHSSGVGRILVQSSVNAVLMIVADILVNQPLQVNLVKNDYVVQQFPAAGPRPAFRDAILPGTPIGSSNQLAAQISEHLRSFSLIPAVPIKDQVARCAVFRKSFAQLLHDPLALGMFGGIEVEDSPPLVADHEEAVEHPKVAVGTVKKSMAAITSRWFLRKINQRFAESPGRPSRGK